MDKAINERDAHAIAKILSANSELVEKREYFYHALDLPPSQLRNIKAELSLNQIFESDAFFRKTILNWISRNGSLATFAQLETTLRKEDFIAGADALKNHVLNGRGSSSSYSGCNNNSSIGFDLPDRNRTFVGRSLILENLHAKIMSQDREATVITTVCGLGGIGKTTLSVEYAWKYYKLGSFNHVIWINSETRVTIRDSFNRLAKKLNIDVDDSKGRPLSLQVLVQNIYQRFINESTLIVFDNAETYKDIEDYLPRPALGGMKPYVLLTSRNRTWADNVDIITIDVFTDDESVSFISGYLGLSTEREISYAKQISENMQNLPLGIKQASAYIKVSYKHIENMEDKLKEFISDWEKNCERALKFASSSITADKYEKTVYLTWNISLEKIKKSNKLAIKIMELIAYFNPDCIPVKLFYSLFEAKKALFNKLTFGFFGASFEDFSERVKAATDLLNSYSLVDLNYSKQTFSVHRLVQKVVKVQNEIKNLKSRMREATALIIKAEFDFHPFDTLAETYLVHAETIRAHLDPQLQLVEIRELTYIILRKCRRLLNTQRKSLVDLYYAKGHKAAFKHLIENYEKLRLIIEPDDNSDWYESEYYFIAMWLLDYKLLWAPKHTCLLSLELDEAIFDAITIIRGLSDKMMKMELIAFVSMILINSFRDRSPDRPTASTERIIDLCVCLDSEGEINSYLALVKLINRACVEEYSSVANLSAKKLNILLEAMLHSDFPVSNFKSEVLRVFARIRVILEEGDLIFVQNDFLNFIELEGWKSFLFDGIQLVKMYTKSEEYLAVCKGSTCRNPNGSTNDAANASSTSISPDFVGRLIALAMNYENTETSLSEEQVYLISVILVCVEIVLTYFLKLSSSRLLF